MTIIKNTLLAMVSSMTVFSGWAQNNSDNLVVSANRFPQPVSSVLAPISVVTRHDIDRWQAKSVADVMRRLPGVDISQNGGLGQKNSLFIRGTNSSHVLILIDGIRLNQAGVSGSSDLSQIPISLVQKIEYIRGPRSALYGSDAIGGVVNIITTRKKSGTILSAGMGSNGYQAYDIATQQPLGNSTIATLAGNYTYTKGYDVVAEGNTGMQSQPDRDGFMSKSLYGSIQHQFNEQFSGFVRGYGYDNRVAYDGYYFPDSALVDTRKLYSKTWDTGLCFQQGIYATQLIGSYSHSKDYNYDPRLGQYDSSASLDDVQQYNLQWRNSIQVAQGNVSAGLDWQKQTTKPGTSYLVDGYEQRNTGVYAVAQQLLGDVTLEGAVRGDDNSQFGWRGTWQTSATWEFVDGYRFIASYGTAYKAPNLGQLYSGSYGNANLKPEESKQWEGGFEGLTGPVNWRISGYRNDVNNLIDTQNVNGVLHYYNIGQAKIKGIEAIVSFDTGLFTHQVSYDYVDPRNAKTNEVLQRRAKQQVKYELDWQVYDFDWVITYHYLGSRYDTDYATYQRVKLGGVSLWELAVSYPVTSHLTVRGSIANLFDKDYETAYGYVTPGREYYLTGSYTF